LSSRTFVTGRGARPFCTSSRPEAARWWPNEIMARRRSVQRSMRSPQSSAMPLAAVLTLWTALAASAR
jgi:hypothetical protein